MTSINPSLYSGQYYSLPSKTSDSGYVSTGSGSQVTSQTQDPNAAATDTVNLSAAAQSYLDSLGFGNSSSSSGTTGSAGSNDKKGFVLTSQQIKKIDDILAKYKDAPFNQDTYNSIQNDLKAAGLSPDQLAAQDQISSFNATQLLIDALNGKDDTTNFQQKQSDEQANSDSYMQSIMSQWQGISTTANASVTQTS